MELPTPFLRGLAGVQVRHSDHKRGIELTLPGPLLPKRRYCQVSVHRERAQGTFLIEVVHEERFSVARRGRNAWQTIHRRDVVGVPSPPQCTMLDRPWSEVRGSYEDKEMLSYILGAAGPQGSDTVMLRCTPEGFQFRVYPSRNALRGAGKHLSRQEWEDLRRELRKAHMHGGPGEGGPVPLWGSFDPAHINCRSVIASRHLGKTAMAHYHGMAMRMVETLPEGQPNPVKQYWLQDELDLIASCRTDLGRAADKVTHSQAHTPIASGYRMLDGICIGSINTVELSIEEGDSNMKKIDTTTHEALPLSVAGQRIVRAQFVDGRGQKDYAYYTDDETIAKDDFVVVVSPYGEVYDDESQGYVKVVKVVSVEETVEAITKASKWIVQKVDLAAYRERMKRIERLKLLDAKIEQAKKEAMRRLELKQLMDMSPELKQLVEERLGLSEPAADEAEG